MIAENAEQLVAMLLIECVIMILPLLFIASDFWAGIRKARMRGEVITSNGWQRTVQKIGRYYNMLLALFLMDSMQIIGLWYLNNYASGQWPLFPWFTFAGAFFVGVIEVKSIMEPASGKEKGELRQVAHLANEIARHRADPEEIAQAIVRYLGSGVAGGKIYRAETEKEEER